MIQPRNERQPLELTVGDPADGGRLSVGERTDGSVWVNASRGTGVTVDLTDGDVARIGRWLLDTDRRKRDRSNVVTRTGSPEHPNPTGAATP